MIDSEGFRANVGIIVCNDNNQLLWCRRKGTVDAWQFPQGGMGEHETCEQAMYRELHEELGLAASAVQLVACTKSWLRYTLPKRFQRLDQKPLCIGQKQKWFLLRLLADESDIKLDLSPKPEFEQWCWVEPDYPAKHVISFKRNVYKRALNELQHFLR